jgi:predicted RNase H-like HicB family nuclease
MITEYLREAMRKAKYKILADGTFYGWVEELPGVWSNGASLNECQQELQAVVEDWLLLGLKLGHHITPLGAIDLGPHEEIVGIEILGASDHLAFERLKPKVRLENLEPA